MNQRNKTKYQLFFLQKLIQPLIFTNRKLKMFQI
ncbi:hypothetical protein GcC1_094040 [Golovinomyces cichoracearum]|uniref:Uncharacterized protein n=1 Tax=Golovinomyces cichoracearum TaxID=62708 RepID=A0A420ID19_9PEZI|nr:hypothetical protein GcC1_094040 [Golovinomyces cichoracearum]